ncbi:MAG: SpoIID/LytB domain-containing protein [Patescibacteria group bacterium]
MMRRIVRPIVWVRGLGFLVAFWVTSQFVSTAPPSMELASEAPTQVARAQTAPPAGDAAPKKGSGVTGEPIVGVRLESGPTSLVLRSESGRFLLEGPGKPREDGKGLSTISETVAADELRLTHERIDGGGMAFFVRDPKAAKGKKPYGFRDGMPFRIRAKGVRATGLNDRSYEGWLEFVFVRSGEGDGTWKLVNRLPMERYIAGVLPGEMQVRSELAALEAQAIACRTYALYQIFQAAPTARIHLEASVMSQVYKGAHNYDKVEEAVANTRGYVMFHQGRVFQAYFHATCGGATASGASIFGAPEIQTLSAVPCTYCRDMKLTRDGWTAVASETEIHRAILAAAQLKGAKLDLKRPIRSIEPVAIQRGGKHSAYLRVTHGGGSFEIDTTLFRLRLTRDGSLVLKSTAFEVERAGDRFRFTGWGHGHGVGMCQNGAREMARSRNVDAIQIVKYYYRGAEVVKVW